MKRGKIDFDKRGMTLLMENVLMIILDVVFLSIVVLFLVKQGSGAIVLEQMYAKEVAMIGNSAQPVMVVKLDMSKGMKVAKNSEIDFGEMVKIEGNIVRVKMSDRGGYEYAFFNDVEMTAYAEVDEENEYTGRYVFVINEKEEENE